jgi:DNA repair protein RadD
VQSWLRGESQGDGEGEGEPRSRRFDGGQLVNSEIISHFIDQQFLDPEDDRVLDELLARPVAGGLTLGDLVSREQLRERLRQQRDAAPAEAPAPIPVSPQRRRQATRKRLAERANSVVMRILADLSLSRPGREVARAGLGTGPGPNVQAVTKLLNNEIRSFTGKAREDLTADETEAAYQELDKLGDAVRDRIRQALGRNS